MVTRSSPRLTALPTRVLEEPHYFEPGKRKPTPIPSRKRDTPIIVRVVVEGGGGDELLSTATTTTTTTFFRVWRMRRMG